jgi:hypothetical protein
MTGAESAKECCQCRQTKPLSEFYTRKERGGWRVHFNKCKACYGVQNRLAGARNQLREKLSLAEAPPPPPPPSAAQEPIPISDRIERIRRDAQELTCILRRYVLRNQRGEIYLRLRPREDDPKRRAVAVAVERLVTGIWDAALGNSSLGFAPVDPRTNREMP